MPRKLLFLAIALPILASSFPTDAPAAWSTLGTQLPTNAMSGTSKSVPDGAGGAIIAFTTATEIGPGEWDYNIGAQRIDAEGNVLWGPMGVVVCAAPSSQNTPVIATDMAEGAIIAWYDARSGNPRPHIQRIDSNGTALWAADGIAIECDSTSAYDSQIVSDGAGGAIVVFLAWGSSIDVLAQRFNPSGNSLWQAGGVPVCAATNQQNTPRAASDGSHGVIATWQDRRTNVYDIYAQRIDASGAARWTTNGVALYASPTKDEYNPVIAADGFGGAIVAWEDYRNQVAGDATCDIYASRIDSLGGFLWGASGVPVVVSPYMNDKFAGIVPDGSGGALFKYEASQCIFMQSLGASGAQRWAQRLQLTPTGSIQSNSVMCGDGAGGAVVAWRDDRIGASTWGVYAQRVDTTKAYFWKAYGTPFIIEATVFTPEISSLDGGNALIIWSRQNGVGTFAKRIEGEHGAGGIPEARITGVTDVPADEGGLLRVALRASDLDNVSEPIYPISTYALWQRVDDPMLLAKLAGAANVRSALNDKLGEAPEGCSLIELGGKTYLSAPAGPATTSMPPGSWELVASMPARQAADYLVRATTVVDSSAAGTPWAVYVATTHSTTTSVWWTSAPDSGYSVDNLAPAPPVGLAGEQSFSPEGLSLAWSANTERDLKGYAVYRGTSADFAASADNRVGSPAAPSFFDAEWSWDAGYHYKVSAIDVHDNESPCAVLGPDGVTGVETPAAVQITRLHQNIPNPFNPATSIRFDLKERGFVSLRVYDASGRLIRVLASGERAAGRYVEAWDGRDEAGRNVASGVYFCRLEAGTFTSAKKMLLLR
jgi:hypothetical protein